MYAANGSLLGPLDPAVNQSHLMTHQATTCLSKFVISKKLAELPWTANRTSLDTIQWVASVQQAYEVGFHFILTGIFFLPFLFLIKFLNLICLLILGFCKSGGINPTYTPASYGEHGTKGTIFLKLCSGGYLDFALRSIDCSACKLYERKY